MLTCTKRLHVCVHGCVQQDLCAVYVGLDELAYAQERPVDVGLGGKVDDRLTSFERTLNCGRVANIALNELNAGYLARSAKFSGFPA